MSNTFLRPDQGLPRDSEVDKLYRQLAKQEPDERLDHLILTAARTDTLASRKKSVPWWKSVLAPFSVIAVAGLTLSISLRLMYSDEMEAPDTRRDSVQTESRNQASKSSPTSNGAAQRVIPAPTHQPAPMAPGSMTAASEIGNLSTRQKASVEPPLTKQVPPSSAEAIDRMESAPILSKREHDFAGQAPAVKESAERTAIRASAPGAAAKSVAAESSPRRSDVAAEETPDSWIGHIRELRRAGRVVEARDSLKRFHEKYPDYVLPEDLR